MDGQTIVIELEPDPLASGRARAAMADLSDQLSEDRLFNLRAVVSELVGNAVKHSATERIRLSVWRRHGQVWGELRESSIVAHIVNAPEAHGYAMRIVDAFATRASPHDDTSRVWFRLD